MKEFYKKQIKLRKHLSNIFTFVSSFKHFLPDDSFVH